MRSKILLLNRSFDPILHNFAETNVDTGVKLSKVKKSSTLEMQRMLLLMRGKLVKYQKLIVTNINIKGGNKTTTSHSPSMIFQTAEVIQKDGNKVKLSCVLTDTFF